MAHFYGKTSGSAGTSGTRCGTKKSGIESIAASWQGAVRTTLYYDKETDTDMVVVSLIPWKGVGVNQELYQGPVNGAGIRLGQTPVVSAHCGG